MAEKREIRISIITLWVGILIPILAAIIPYVISQLSPDHRLEYDLVGPITAKGTTALRLVIVNNGNKVEKAVKVWIKASYASDIADLLRPKGEKRRDPIELLLVDSKTSITVAKERDYYVLSLGDVRPREEIALSVATSDVSLSIYNFRSGPDGIEIKSEDQVAVHKGSSFLSEFVYPFGFWMAVILMILLLAAAVWQEYLMSPKMRERMILKEIDKLK